MTLKDQGYRLCISPDKKRGRWISVIEHEINYRLEGYLDWCEYSIEKEQG